MTPKQQFLLEHNRLAPPNMKATEALLSRFRMEKAAMFKDGDWSIEKLRRPFILWLTSLSLEEKERIEKNKNSCSFADLKPEPKISQKDKSKYKAYPIKKGTIS